MPGRLANISLDVIVKIISVNVINTYNQQL
jgi:hypothetical protein